jgi:hypothetical protein
VHEVFISATTRDLASARMHLTKLVLQAGHHPIVEQGFRAQSNDVQLREFLNLHLRACSAVIHLAGRCYGGEATSRLSRATPRSWTQMEYIEAKRLGKKIFVGLVEPAFYRGKRYRETGGPEEQRRKAQSQRDHSMQLQKGIYYSFSRSSDLTAPVASFLQQLGAGATSSKTKILFIGAEQDTGLDLRGQLRRTRQALSVSPGAPGVSLVPLFNATPGEIFEAINREQPSIVHLSGRQNGGRILLHDERRKLAPFDADLLAQSLARTTSRSLKLVVLDTCASMKQAKVLVELGVPYAIGIYGDIADDVATDFYARFYSQIGSGGDLKSAVDGAYAQVTGSIVGNPRARKQLEKILEEHFDPSIHIPRLVSGSGLDPAKELFA